MARACASFDHMRRACVLAYDVLVWSHYLHLTVTQIRAFVEFKNIFFCLGISVRLLKKIFFSTKFLLTWI